MYAPAKCIKCGTCVAVCPEGAITLSNNGITTNDALCTMCGRCAEVCPTMAIGISGKPTSVPEIMAIIDSERIFFDQSGGGVTFSGGEPLLHAELLMELLDECGKRGIHRAVDTAGHVTSAVLLHVAQRTDLFLYDLKLMDSDLHKHWTGVRNEKILSNLGMLAASGAKIIVRVPLVAGVNDHEGNIRQTAEFISALPGEKMEVHLLPYHAIARHKYAKLGKHETFNELEEPGAESLQNVIGWFAEYGIRSQVGG